MDTREWVIGLINDTERGVQQFGPRGGERKVVRPFDASLIVEAWISGGWCNDRTGSLDLHVALTNGDWIVVSGDYREGSDDTLKIPLG